ncbi:hypothetical protein EYR40_002508 [Pleurotus pulmonarius]|nr:hypothetical protein EYR40_002508 [Pleurotus pulmonarius]
MASARVSPYAQAAPDAHAIPEAHLATPKARLATPKARRATPKARRATPEARRATTGARRAIAEPLLTPYQLRQVQHMAANVLVDAYTAGMLPYVLHCPFVISQLTLSVYGLMNDELLRRRVEYYLDWPAHHLDTCQGHMAISQLRCIIYTWLCNQLASTTLFWVLHLNTSANSFELRTSGELSSL